MPPSLPVKKLELTSLMLTNVVEMLSLERGVLVRTAMRDHAKAEGYHGQFIEHSKLLTSQILEIRPMVVRDEGKKDLSLLEQGLAVWLPAHDALWQHALQNQTAAAMSVYDQRTLPQAKAMQKAMDDLRAFQQVILAEAVEQGHSQVSRSYWIVSVCIVLFLAIWGVALIAVRRASAGQEREVELKAAAAEHLNRLLEKIERNSRGLTDSSEELTGISQQMAGAAEETAAQANVVSAASEQVSKNVEVVATSAEELMASIREISKSSTEAARVAKNAVSVAEQTNRRIAKLTANPSIEIGKVIKGNHVNRRTNQSSGRLLNATIEAARAGETGKRLRRRRQ